MFYRLPASRVMTVDPLLLSVSVFSLLYCSLSHLHVLLHSKPGPFWSLLPLLVWQLHLQSFFFDTSMISHLDSSLTPINYFILHCRHAHMKQSGLVGTGNAGKGDHGEFIEVHEVESITHCQVEYSHGQSTFRLNTTHTVVTSRSR